jgi:hypothetical protein
VELKYGCYTWVRDTIYERVCLTFAIEKGLKFISDQTTVLQEQTTTVQSTTPLQQGMLVNSF